MADLELITITGGHTTLKEAAVNQFKAVLLRVTKVIK